MTQIIFVLGGVWRATSQSAKGSWVALPFPKVFVIAAEEVARRMTITTKSPPSFGKSNQGVCPSVPHELASTHYSTFAGESSTISEAQERVSNNVQLFVSAHLATPTTSVTKEIRCSLVGTECSRALARSFSKYRVIVDL